MNAIWYFDFISPFAYLQWPRIKALSSRVEFEFRPILLAGLLQHHGHKGPAEIPAKRAFTYRMVQWQAQRDGVTLKFPPAHPFNPIASLRLCIAAGGGAEVIEAIFTHLWRDGLAGDSHDALQLLASTLGIENIGVALSDAAVKSQLRANFESAVADGVFGVPTVVAEGELFWGNDATAMFEDWLADPGVFDTEAIRQLRQLPVAVQRQS
jgi:2-hydroxychromene-2-carboxylate isomerase